MKRNVRKERTEGIKDGIKDSRFPNVEKTEITKRAQVGFV